MTTATLDTLQFVKRLKNAGIKETEAEAIAEAVRDSQANSDWVTKQDLANTEAKLEVKIAETRTEIAETKAELVKWVVSVGVLQTAIIGALLMKLIPG